MLPATIPDASKKSVSTLTSPCGSPPTHLPSSDMNDTKTVQKITRDGYGCDKSKTDYFDRVHDRMRFFENLFSIALCVIFIRGLLLSCTYHKKFRDKNLIS